MIQEIAQLQLYLLLWGFSYRHFYALSLIHEVEWKQHLFQSLNQKNDEKYQENAL